MELKLAFPFVLSSYLSFTGVIGESSLNTSHSQPSVASPYCWFPSSAAPVPALAQSMEHTVSGPVQAVVVVAPPQQLSPDLTWHSLPCAPPFLSPFHTYHMISPASPLPAILHHTVSTILTLLPLHCRVLPWVGARAIALFQIGTQM